MLIDSLLAIYLANYFMWVIQWPKISKLAKNKSVSVMLAYVIAGISTAILPTTIGAIIFNNSEFVKDMVEVANK